MELTKYEHACFTVEKDGKILVVDPGGLSTDFNSPERVVAVVITHQHWDHLDGERLAAIFDKNDDVLILGPADVIEKVEIEHKRTVEAGEKVTVGPFDLEFFGGVHALIHESLARVQNLGVLINDLIYYPGDSFALPGRPVDTLAVPANAPWMKLGEAMDFLVAVHPRFAFPTHDELLNANGKQLADTQLGDIAGRNDIEYARLSEPIEV